MLSDDELPKFMEDSLNDVYNRMSRITTNKEFQRLLSIAPAFIYTKINDYLRAIKADYIIVLVPPDKYYEFEILLHDPDRNRVIINSMEFKRITEDKFNELVMDYYPMLATI